MRLSVILPTYNEVGNIVPLLEAIIRNLGAGPDVEIIVVDDNSPDGTLDAVRAAFPEGPVVPILRTTDRGLARSIRAGIEAATGDRIAVLDTDFTHDPDLLPTMVHLAERFDVVVGSRFCAGGGMPDLPHYLASLVYNWGLRIVLRTQIQDSLSGYFVINRATLEKLPFDSIFSGYGDYFFRLLFFAQRNRASIVEMPVVYDTRRKGESKSVFWKLLFSYSLAALKLRFGDGRRYRAISGERRD